MTAETTWCDTMTVPELIDTFHKALSASKSCSYVEMCVALRLTDEYVNEINSLESFRQVIAVRVNDLCKKYVEVKK